MFGIRKEFKNNVAGSCSLVDEVLIIDFYEIPSDLIVDLLV